MIRKYKIGTDHLLDFLEKRMIGIWNININPFFFFFKLKESPIYYQHQNYLFENLEM